MSSHPFQAAPFFLGPTSTDTACLLIHGFSGTPSEMRGLGEALAEQGVRVYGMLVAGHRGDPEALLASGRRTWLASAEEGLAQLASYRRVFVAGLSMGGVLALLLASRHQDRIAGVIAMSTPTRFRGKWQYRLLPLARYVMTWYYPLSQLNLADPAIQQEVLKQARLRSPGATIDFTDERVVQELKRMVRIPIPAVAELVALTNQGRRSIKHLRVPLLIIHSKRDQTVEPACAEELYRLAQAAPTRSLRWLTRSDHVVTTGPEREEVFRLAADFIARAAPAGEAHSRSADARTAEPDETSLDR